jgi:hypothetical protein
MQYLLIGVSCMNAGLKTELEGTGMCGGWGNRARTGWRGTWFGRGKILGYMLLFDEGTLLSAAEVYAEVDGFGTAPVSAAAPADGFGLMLPATKSRNGNRWRINYLVLLKDINIPLDNLHVN